MTEDSRITIAFVENRLKLGGGCEQVVHDVIRGIDHSRFRPVLVCLHDLGELGEPPARDGVKTYHDVAGHSLDPRNVLRLARILRREQTDVLYVTDCFHNMVAGRLAAFLARTRESILIFHSYDTVLRKGAKPLKLAMLKVFDFFLHPRFTRIVALSESHKKYLSAVKGIPSEKIRIVYNGIDSDRYSSGANAQEVRTKYGLKADQQVVGMIAGLKPWKAHDMLLKSAAIVLQQSPDTVFVLAGDGSERERLEKMSEELGVASNIRFLGTVHNVPELLAVLNVSVLSSDHEAFPLSLLESMAASLPMVATDVGSVSEIVEDGVNGFLVPPGAHEEFANAIVRLVTDPELARRLGDNGRKKLQDRFTLDRMVSRCDALFTECAEDLIKV